jgi:flagellar motor switch protein FliG
MSADHRYETLSGAEKAAILLLAIGEEPACRLLAMLDLEEVKQVSRTMTAMGEVESTVVERLMGEFGRRLAGSAEVAGGSHAVERLLQKALDPERATGVIEEIRGSGRQPVWERLGEMDAGALAGYLGKEHAQTVAIILGRLKAPQAARLLARLEETLAVEVVTRMLQMDPVRNDVLAEIERTLRADLTDRPVGAVGSGHDAAVADMLSFLDRATEQRLLDGLEGRSREATERVRSLMFTFDDLARLDGAAIQALLRTAGNGPIALALKGAGQQLKDLVFANMSERAAKILREEIEQMGAVRLRAVEEAQRLLVNTAKELAESGAITLGGGGEAELVG